MSTMTSLIHDYTKKHNLTFQSVVYTHTYDDGSTEDFTIETAEKEINLYDPEDREKYSAIVPTKQFQVTINTDMFQNLDWFDGRRFRTIESAIKAIQKDVKE